MKFLHVADVHLGNQQYNSKERCNDFFLAFKQVAEIAVSEKVQVCLVAGDLFHNAALDASTLLQAERCLKTMCDAGIKVLAVAGNHDRHRYRDTFSWLQYLEAISYLTLLERGDNQEAYLVPNQTYIDLNGIRFIGVPYFGSASRKAFEQVANDLPLIDQDGIHYTVLITHSGIEGQIADVAGCVPLADLQKLRPFINYFATGHLHKPFIIDDWIHNPGAIENCDINEEQYRELGKGVFIVEVEANGQAKINKHTIKGRPFHSIDFRVDVHLKPEDLVRDLTATLHRASKNWDSHIERWPVVRVRILGNLAFDRTQLDIEQIRHKLESEINCLILRMQVETSGFEPNIENPQEIAFDVLEKEIFEEFARSDARYSEQAAIWATLMRDIKTLVQNEHIPEEIYECLRDQVIKTKGL